MAFSDIVKIESKDFYFDVAVKRANKASSSIRSKIRQGAFIEKKAKAEAEKFNIIKDSLITSLHRIIKTFPSFDDLSEFYKELLKLTLDYKDIKQALGAVNWAEQMIIEFTRKYTRTVRGAREQRQLLAAKRQYYGRLNSVLKQISKSLKLLEQVRKILVELPVIKEKLPVVVIYGFPNAGKTTLLYKLTGSRPEINSYAFTTKNINVGYMEHNHNKIQLLDTPGTLNRLDKMNNAEKQAHLALRYCADLVIYVFDLTETSYSLEKQLALYKKIKMKKPVLPVLSKQDLLDKKVINEFCKNHKINALSICGIKGKIKEKLTGLV